MNRIVRRPHHILARTTMNAPVDPKKLIKGGLHDW